MITRALSPFGVEIVEHDLGSITPAAAEELAVLISRARVAVFRDQRIDDMGLVAFLRALGEIAFTEGEPPVPGVPDLNVVSNVERTMPPRSVFHSDTSYVAEPPSYTALRVVTTPGRGGATLFSDQVAVAVGLPQTVRDRLHGRTVLHGSAGSAGRAEANRHPLFRRHPLTGEVSLYLSTPARCSALSGTDERTSARVIELLYRRSTKSSGLYRHEWRPRDVVVWDNRVTLHKADHDGVVGDRVLHRGMVRGEVPVAA